MNGFKDRSDLICLDDGSRITKSPCRNISCRQHCRDHPWPYRYCTHDSKLSADKMSLISFFFFLPSTCSFLEICTGCLGRAWKFCKMYRDRKRHLFIYPLPWFRNIEWTWSCTAYWKRSLNLALLQQPKKRKHVFKILPNCTTNPRLKDWTMNELKKDGSAERFWRKGHRMPYEKCFEFS